MKYHQPQSPSLIRRYSLAFAALWLLSAAALFAETFDLVSEGRPVAEIVIPSDEEIAKIPLWLLGTQLAEGAENRLKPATMDPWSRAGVRPAVKFFNAALEECVGTSLPVVSERTPGSRAIVFEVEPAKLMDDDTFSIEFPDEDTLLVRGSGRSVHWALNHILHEHAGVRWLFLNHTHYPKSDHLSVPRSEVRQSPSYKFERKESYYRERMMDYYQSMNLKPKSIPRDAHHAMIDFAFPVTKYAHDQSWPVEIMPVRNGKKVVLPLPEPGRPARNQEAFHTRWQPCFSNPKTAEIAIENILEILDQDPLRQRIDLGIMDKGGECECEDCLAIVPGRLNQIGYPDYSEVYYAWVNKVVEGVTQKYPDVYFPLIAYRETWTAPSFKVHPKVIPFIGIDTHHLMDPELAEEKWKNIKDWSEKASQLGTSEYLSGISCYALPRTFFKLQSDFYKKLHQLGGVGNRAQTFDREGSEGEGPKIYLRARLLWDINADPEELMDEWYRLTVGEAAAPYLREYFQFWEDYATGDRIRRTNWFKDYRDGMCFRMMDWESNRSQSYTFALDKGDMARLRKLMEQVVAHTETPEQAARAARLMLAFEYYECNAYALFSEIMPPEGVLPDPAAAVEVIEAAPEAYTYAAKRQGILDAISPQPIFARGGTFDIHETMADIFARISPHMDDPKVQAALERLRVDERIPAADRERLLDRATRKHQTASWREKGPLAIAKERQAADIVMDGNMSDPFWQELPVYALRNRDDSNPAVNTEFRIGWTDDAIYFGVRCEEPDMAGLVISSPDREQPDAAIFEGDIVELLIETADHAYYQIVVNPAGVVVDLDWSNGRPPDYGWSSGAQAAALVGEDYWSVEVRIPLIRPASQESAENGGITGTRPTEDAPWFFNVGRQRSNGNERESVMFSPTFSPRFNEPSRFVRLIVQ